MWVNGSSLIDQDGDNLSSPRGFATGDEYGGQVGVEASGVRPYKKVNSVGSVNGNGFKNYMVGVGSRGPDMVWDTKDDIATWPSDTGGGI